MEFGLSFSHMVLEELVRVRWMNVPRCGPVQEHQDEACRSLGFLLYLSALLV